MDNQYLISIRLRFNEIDDVGARIRALKVKQDLARYVESPGAEFKLQKLIEGQKPVGMDL